MFNVQISWQPKPYNVSGSAKEAVGWVVRKHKGSATFCAGESGIIEGAGEFVLQDIYIAMKCALCTLWAGRTFWSSSTRRYWRVHMHAITMQCLCRSLVFLCCETQNHLEDVVVCIAGRANPSWHGCDMCWLRFFFLRRDLFCAPQQFVLKYMYVPIRNALCKL